MIYVNASELQNSARLDCDTVIVGAGAAGLILAREFAASTNEAVIVLEAGGTRIRHSDQRHFAGSYAGPLRGRPLSISRWRGVGGSTQRWAGQCGRMTRSDFEGRSWVANSGWPFGYEEIEPYYARAEDALRLAPFEEDTPVDGASQGALSVRGFRFPPERDLGVLFREALEPARNIRIVLDAVATEVDLNREGTNAAGVSARAVKGGSFRVSAKRTVLAANGIENARLLVSSSRVHASGIGNAHDSVGRYFMDHPYFWAGILDLDLAETAWPGSTVPAYEDVLSRARIDVIQMEPATLRAEQLVNCGVMVVGRHRFKSHPGYLSQPVDDLHTLLELITDRRARDPEVRRLLPRVARNFGPIAAAYARGLAPGQHKLDRAALRTTVEPVPDRASRLRWLPGRDEFGLPQFDIDWRLGSLECRSLLRVHELLSADLARRTGSAIDLRLDVDAETGFPKPLQGGRHYMGTTRMDASSRTGVVDADCRVHGVSNLYVAGSSVFPTGSYVNPTLTIAALAIRLADHLKRY